MIKKLKQIVLWFASRDPVRFALPVHYRPPNWENLRLFEGSLLSWEGDFACGGCFCLERAQRLTSVGVGRMQERAQTPIDVWNRH